MIESGCGFNKIGLFRKGQSMFKLINFEVISHLSQGISIALAN